MVDIRKSPADDRTYRYAQLPNGVKCLAISDPQTDMSAAAMSVKAGSFSDPEDIQGLSHFLEHMLFLGTEKYPNEQTYESFIKANAGNTNAYTAHTQTNYYFSIAQDKLEPVLDIFAQFFIAPLFTESCVDREMHAVDSENTKNLNDDMWRHYQLFCSLASPTHPLHLYGTGNLTTLQVPQIREKLINHYRQHYSADLMSFVVLGREDVGTLLGWCESHFSKVPKFAEPHPNEPLGLPYDQSHLGTLTKVVSIMDKKEVKLAWQFPAVEHLYASKPQKYLGHLLGHEGKNSILSMLKAEGLALELSAGCHYTYPDFSFFEVSIDLTDKGMEQYEAVLEIVYQYIEMLRTKGVQEWIFEEIKKTELAEFQFKSKTNPMNYTSSLAGDLHIYPPTELLTARCLVEEYRPEQISQLIDLMRPNNMVAFLLSKEFEDCTETEKWYGTRYSNKAFSPTLLGKMTQPGFSHTSLVLDLPPRNRFIPDTFTVLPAGTSPLPVLIVEKDNFVLFHKQDDTFQKDSVHCYVQLLSADAGYVSTPEGRLCGRIYVKFLTDHLRELTYLAEMSGFKVTIKHCSLGIAVEIKGFSQHYGAFLGEVFTQWAELTISNSHESKFQEYSESLHRELENHSMEQPYEQVIAAYSDVLSASAYHTHSELLRALSSVDFPTFSNFSRKWLKALRLEWLLYGNIAAEEAERVVCHCVGILSSQRTALPKEEVPCELNYELPPQGAQAGLALERELADPTEENSCIYSYWQAGIETIPLHAQLLILENIISSPCYSMLRTEKQLGYVVWSLLWSKNGTIGLGILIQSHVASPSQLVVHIDEFIATMRTAFRELPDEKFLLHQESAYNTTVKKDTQPSDEFTRYKNELTNRRYRFNKREELGAAVKETTKEAVKALFERLFYEENRRIDLQIVSANLKPQHMTAPAAYKSLYALRRRLAIYPASPRS